MSVRDYTDNGFLESARDVQMTTKAYRVSNKSTGHNFGIYRGDSEQGAVDAMHRDAGYESREHANEAAPTLEGEIVASEVPMKEWENQEETKLGRGETDDKASTYRSMG